MGNAPALQADWLSACRRASVGLRAMLAARPSTHERAVEIGTRGQGGDRTLVIDEAAEAIVLAELEALRAQGYRFRALSEELGEIDYGGDEVLVIIDPIDGSLNAKRGLPHHALSVAVAAGSTMADVEFAYVYDFGPAEEWWAARGQGAWRNGELLDPAVAERRTREGKLEVLGIESANPRWVALSIDGLVASAYRLRALGTIASSLCQVAGGRFDGMVSLRGCRSVDAAAGQLIVREAGGVVSFVGFGDPLAAPLDLIPHAPVAAARSLQTLREIEQIPRVTGSGWPP
ncbi:MAG: inositol monophosphatase family protein [Solirubrobacteraceae bacterium]